MIDGGRIVESGPTEDVIRHPRTPFTARIAGLNMIGGRSDADGVRHSDGQLIQGVSKAPTRAGEPAIAVFSPTAVVIFTEEPHSSARNIIAVTITELEPRDEQVRVRAATATASPSAPTSPPRPSATSTCTPAATSTTPSKPPP